MDKKIITFIVGVFATCFSGSVFAESIDNLKALISSDGKDLYVSWDAAANESIFNADGYAVQWSDRQSDVQIDKTGRKFLGTQDNSFSIVTRDFDRDQDYYFRVYTYKKEGTSLSDSVLGNGSKILKLRIKSDSTLEMASVEPNDPVISSTSTIDALEDFGKVRVLEYDTFADFYWSRPRKLVSSDYDGFQVLISKEPDMRDPVAILETSRTVFEGRVKGLQPETIYYAQGFFYKDRAGESQRFGSGDRKQFKTSRLIKRSVGRSGTRLEQKISRNIAKVEKQAIRSVTVGGAEVSSSVVASSSMISSTSSRENKASVYSATTQNSTLPYSAVSIDKLNSEKDIKGRIGSLQKNIEKMEKELASWQKKLRELKSPIRSSQKSVRSRSTTRTRAKSSSTSRRVSSVGARYGRSAVTRRAAQSYRGRSPRN